MNDLSEARRQLVGRLRDAGVVADPRVSAALARVPREEFLPSDALNVAYRDEPVAIGSGQTMSAPHMVAIMLEALALEPGQRVLEVGGGSGYHAALVAELVRPGGEVVSLERLPSLADRAREVLSRLRYDEVTVVVTDGALGYPPREPYDRIFLACAAPRVPEPLLKSLAPAGRLLVPVGARDEQELMFYVKRPDGGLDARALGGVRFVPLVSPLGFPP